MSAASIDRYLKGAKASDQIRGVSTAKPAPLLRSSLYVRGRSGDGVVAEPGFFEGDTRRALRPEPEGRVRSHPEADRCAYRVGVHTQRAQQRPHHILGALEVGVEEIPFEMTGLDTELLNKTVIKLAGE